MVEVNRIVEVNQMVEINQMVEVKSQSEQSSTVHILKTRIKSIANTHYIVAHLDPDSGVISISYN